MDQRVGLLFLFLLSAACACVARELPNNLISTNAAKYEISERSRIPFVCPLCEHYSAMALDYLNANKTQNEIIEILHNSCSQLPSFKQQCITLVDYAPLFFLEIASIQPEDFCKWINLCQLFRANSCGFCKGAVAELLVKMKDPNTEMEIIQALLKGGNSIDKYATKCKRMVLEHGPVIFANVEKFLETRDMCTALHACKAPTEAILANGIIVSLLLKLCNSLLYFLSVGAQAIPKILVWLYYYVSMELFAYRFAIVVYNVDFQNLCNFLL